MAFEEQCHIQEKKRKVGTVPDRGGDMKGEWALTVRRDSSL